ncbi:serine-rich adhesin for platelets [Puntigrus tetrazona]|uniref:serine-rich adhesin for platelets n=1 Tax=Puntigrus tetrazona TaxID=1606681 RepID=UPI001C8AFFEB|nr:serine-rich adhesin for platelets [Puntigrus tetrazona]
MRVLETLGVVILATLTQIWTTQAQALGPVTSVSVSYTCASASSVVSWTAVVGATTYRSTAVSHSGTVLSCTTSTTECEIKNLACGENYMVHVTALSDNCESTSNATTSFQTVPCAPSNLMLYRECSSNVIVFSWAPNNYSAYYYARGVDSIGKVMESPCQVNNMRSSTDCQTGLLTSRWDAADRTLQYTVEAFGNRGNQSHYMCSSLTQSCTISGINCGESLTMLITAADEECSSVLSLGEVGQTAPCVPQNVSALMDCGSDSITLTWESSLGAFFYFATAVDQFGTVRTCTSSDTKCKFSGLRCGSLYKASLIASNINCNSSVSDTINVETAPCPPGSVEALLDCQENQALVSWLGTRSMISFTATMEDQLGGLLSCSTTANSCRIPNLKCGQVYDISVIYHDGICPSMPSHAIQMKSDGGKTYSWNRTEDAEGYIATVVSKATGELVYCNSTSPFCNVTNLQCGDSYSVQVRSYNRSCLSMLSSPVVVREVPCVPINVTARRTCGSSAVEVSWSASRGAQSYVAVAVGDDGHRTKCSSNTTSCSILDLHCSSLYSISLVAVDGNCSSWKSQNVTLRTVPCPPTNVQSTMNCTTNSATLSWTASPNSVSYRGRASGRDGHNVTCDTKNPGCQLNGLHCGQEYVFVVTASDGNCESPDSVENRHETAPCAPQSVSRFLDCASNSLIVRWALGPTALNYTALARTTGGAVLSCTTTSSSCIVTGLQCGKNYTAVVTANNACQGPETVTPPLQTVPCIPTSVHASVECVNNTVRASWGQAAGALSYIGVLTGPDHYKESCATSGLSCSFRGLTCAQTYTLNVISLDSQCNSSVSPNVSVATGPCDPASVTAVLKCDSRTANVSWHAAAGASTYTVLAQTQDQSIPSSSCRTSATSCDLTQIHCGEVFNVTVLADDGTCNSSARASTTLESAPCSPIMRPPSLNCSTNAALVSWLKDPDALSVRVSAASVLGQTATCNSSANSCSLDALLCGRTYTVYGVAQGPQCESVPSAPFNITTAPCTPAQVSANYSCGTSTDLSWTDSLGRESFYVLAQTNGHSGSCSTVQTHCSINSLRCGSLYNVSVDSISGRCNSSQSAHTQLQTAPCAPKNVTVRLQCLNNTAVVSWEASLSAVGYNVTAVGQDGDIKYSTVAGTSCQLPNMHCGQTYDIVITPFSQTCTGFPTAPYTFNAGSCPATDVQVSLQCNGNVGLVHWTAAKNAESYIAMATGKDGQTRTCTSTSTNCTFSDLHCGENYTVTVATVERGCQSPPSTSVSLRSAICPPSNLAGHTNCATSDISITWDPSPVSRVNYILFINQVDGLNSTFNTTQTSYVLRGLHCGMSFIVQAAAQDSTCTSPYGSPTPIYTAPCPPSSLTAAASCGTNRATISWLNGTGAYTYTANVVGSNGQTISCTSSTNSCSVKVDCGSTYTATVVSTLGSCNSTTNNSIHFDSAACLPSNVMAQLDCNSNMLAVHWDPSPNNPDSYTALAIGTDGTRVSCNTSSTSCTILNLRCGRTYSIAVTTSKINCGVIEGSDYQIRTAPCQPQSPNVQLQCSTNTATVTWDNNGADQFDTVTALNFTGGAMVCNSKTRSCTFAQLQCGESYSLSVVGSNGNCTSAPSDNFSLDTAPCVPNFVVATTNCDTSITTVTWDSARGANSYTVHAVSTTGQNGTCTNTDTTCSLPQLDCGQNYTITVTAEDDTCVGVTSAPITVTTVPCPHSNLQATLDCRTDSALISWTSGKGTLMYNASAVGFDVDHQVSCSTPGSACNVTNLHCGSRYQVSVRGDGFTCSDQSDDWIALKTAPCPPTQVSIKSSCDSNTVSVAWNSSQGSVSYMAVAKSNTDHRVTCNSSQLTCDISGLQCGQTYQIHVSGVDGDCIGSRSEVRILETAPCVPQNVKTILKCQATVLNVTWQQKGQAHHYHATVRSSDGKVLGCDSNTTFCQVPNIHCGLTYSVTVVAYSQTCNSSQSSVQHVTSAPCPPDAIFAILDCDLNTISVSWDSSVNGVLYIAHAFNSNNNYNYTCNTTETSCDITVTCGIDYNVTVIPLRDGCNGKNSPVQYIIAAPCVPIMLDVEMDCLSDSAWLTWEESAGAELYIATATDSDGQEYECNSTDSQCTVEQLQCGRFYNFSVIASNSQCDSQISNTLQTETAPCPPQNVITSLGCDTGTVSVMWDESFGVLSYTATLERTDGETTCCTASSTSCEVPFLPCGQMYALTVTAEGRTCNSSQSLEVIVRSVPCIPESLVSSTSCSDNVVTMAWVSNEAGELYTIQAFSDDGLYSDSCSGFGQSCDLTSLMCGVPYTATVIAQDSICSSAPSQAAPIRTVPCVPDHVTANVSCQGNDVSVFWKESAGADVYTAMLEDSNGQLTSCQSMNHATCTVNRLVCGQTYRVSVIASDGYCDSLPSAVTDVHSAPCMPHNIRALLDCHSSMAVLSWQPGTGAGKYMATAVRESGHVLSCESNDTYCELTGLACGESYNITVLAEGDTCSTTAAMNGHLNTGPCAPQNIEVRYGLSIGQLSWDRSRGASTYTAHAANDLGSVLSCSTSDTSCALYNMSCSQTYDITVTAHNNICRGTAVSASTTLNTEPCPPHNVQTHLNCTSGVGTVSWEESLGAVAYVAFLEGRNGQSLSCSTTSSSCSVTGLMCGTIYNTQVRAIGETYNSTDSETVLFTSAPCLPVSSSVTVDVNCENATASFSWAWSSGAASYELTAISNNGYIASCISQDNFCIISKLACGQTYTVRLAAINDKCQVTKETGVTFQTRPCSPLHVNVNLQCKPSKAIVTWEQRDDVLYYLVSASLSTGVTDRVCNSTTDSCEMSGLQCGVEYAFTVKAYSSHCHSDVSTTVHITTEPCQPTQPTVSGSCNNNTVLLNWSHSRGASSYTMHITGNLGYMDSFQTIESTLTVELLCGQTYTFTTLGENDVCDSIPSTPAHFTTAPCVPYHIETYAECENNLGAVSWASSDGADIYTAIAIGQDNHTHVCITNTTHCIWEELHCGENYFVQVIASAQICNSGPSDGTVIHMAPCVPKNLVSSFQCDMKVASLTWEASENAHMYVVSAESDSGQTVELSTSATSAQFSEFNCGQSYYLTVQAVGNICRSQPSNSSVLKTEPCTPTSVLASTDCISNIATISWEAADGAEYYTATVYGPDGPLGTCMSWSSSCGMAKLSCGVTYNVSVIASSRLCNSTPSALSALNSVPCVPTGLSVMLDCATAEARVSWNASMGALYYITYAWSSTFNFISCESSGPDTHCTLSDLICGETYTIQVIAVGDECSSLPSQAENFRTVPCAPDVTATLDCNTDSVSLQWTPIAGSIFYTANASTPEGLVSTCSSNSTNCKLSTLVCGKTYNVTMVSYDGICHSMPGTALAVASGKKKKIQKLAKTVIVIQ